MKIDMVEKGGSEKKEIKILVLSYEPWDVTNSFGNSYRAIFSNIENIQVANIYCKYGRPNDEIITRAFQITDKSILQSIVKGTPSGKEINLKNDSKNVHDILTDTQTNFFRRHRFRLVFWARDLLWITGKWWSEELEQFVIDFNPDIIWCPIYYSVYLNQMAFYFKEMTEKPMVGYSSDDDYTLKQFNLSPLYWIERFIKRVYIKKTIDLCEQLYVITSKQKQEFDRIFGKNCKILCKGADFSGKMPFHESTKETINILFMGNLSDGRWKSILEVTEVLKRINREKGAIRFSLHVHSMTPLSKSVMRKINIKPFIPDEAVDKAVRGADILLHVEPLDLSERLKFRLSFSTKIVTYLENASCILAYGGMTGTMQYLVDAKAGIYAGNMKKLYKILNYISENPQIIEMYRKRAWDCGMKRHDEKKIGKEIRFDLEKLIVD